MYLGSAKSLSFNNEHVFLMDMKSNSYKYTVNTSHYYMCSLMSSIQVPSIIHTQVSSFIHLQRLSIIHKQVSSMIHTQASSIIHTQVPSIIHIQLSSTVHHQFQV